MRKYFVILLGFIFSTSCQKTENRDIVLKYSSQEIKPELLSSAVLSSGKLYRVVDFPTQNITPRPVDIWLPENYSEDKEYAVLYMHDGQMLFDSTSTWNKQEWRVDEWSSQLMQQGKVRNFIVVGIHNITQERWFDLFPQKALDVYMNKKTRDSIVRDAEANNGRTQLSGDGYLKFMVNELKPFIDRTYSTLKNRANTFVAGSSMGGLMSMYAISEYPEVFGGAACISTHWPGIMPKDNNPFPEAIFKYMEANLPKSGTHKLYFDYGNKTLDEHYPQYAPNVGKILSNKGYTSENSANIFFKNTDHSENSWNKRLDKPLMFLLELEPK